MVYFCYTTVLHVVWYSTLWYTILLRKVWYTFGMVWYTYGMCKLPMCIRLDIGDNDKPDFTV